ncbi:unnamed protein product [Paramecium octaurelia]|uniref:Uncharacterized protein n=1 Tax=Paramecium octaurelia TaxID=43137 RepID=A0A8S1T8J8_PAROT|nr:unnamed protein product [Paramecium octaurelia]
MEFALTATMFSFFGWNVYLLIKKYRERQRQNYLQNLIDQESDYLIMNVAPYKKIKVNEDKQAIIKPIYTEDADSSSDDFELISYRRRKTILEKVKQENFQVQTYIENTKPFDMLPVDNEGDSKLNKSNKEFSFTNQNQDVNEAKRLRKNSKINIDDSFPLDSPKQILQNSSNKVSDKKITQFESSNLKEIPEIQDSKQESDNCITSVITHAEQIQDAQGLAENKNVLLQFPIQVQNTHGQTKDQQNQLNGVQENNIFGKLLFQQKPNEYQQSAYPSPKVQTLQSPQQNNNLLFQKQKANNANDVIQFQLNQIPQLQTQTSNNGLQVVDNQQSQLQQQQPQPQPQELQQPQLIRQQQQISLFQQSQTQPPNMIQIPDLSLDQQNKDNQNGSSVNKNLFPSNFTFGINLSVQTNSKGGLFDSLLNNNNAEQLENSKTTSNINQDQTNNNQQSLFLQQSQPAQSISILPQPNMGTSLFGNTLSAQQPKEQVQQNQVGGLFNFSLNTQTGCNLFQNLQKN